MNIPKSIYCTIVISIYPYITQIYQKSINIPSCQLHQEIDLIRSDQFTGLPEEIRRDARGTSLVKETSTWNINGLRYFEKKRIKWDEL